MKKPRALVSGDKIALTCPAGAVEVGEERDAIDYLTARGYQVVIGETVGHRFHRFSGSDDMRRSELQAFMDDPEIAAIWCGRGGYGSVRIIEGLDFEAYSVRPKWLIGFSDITCLHSFFQNQAEVMSIHGHMLKGFQEGQVDFRSTSYLMDILEGRITHYEWTSDKPVDLEVRGRLLGGNLALLSDLAGTCAKLQLKEGDMLIIEDISEYYYNIDRMMMHLRLAGYLQCLSALIVGSFSDTQDNEEPFGESIMDIMERVTSDYHIPVIGALPFGHQKQNWPILLGSEYVLQSEGCRHSLTMVSDTNSTV